MAWIFVLHVGFIYFSFVFTLFSLLCMCMITYSHTHAYKRTRCSFFHFFFSLDERQSVWGVTDYAQYTIRILTMIETPPTRTLIIKSLNTLVSLSAHSHARYAHYIAFGIQCNYCNISNTNEYSDDEDDENLSKALLHTHNCTLY